MDRDNKYLMEKHSWSSLRAKTKKINPELANIIDELSPSDKYTFYTLKYPYGALIVDRGVFQVINENGMLVPLQHSSITNNIKEDLGYNKMIPTGFISKNSIETFFMAKNHTIPASLYGLGDMLALWHVLEGNNTYQVGPVWNISSGARTVFMLPKITDKNSYKTLKAKYALKLIPQNLNEHWQIFSHLANHAAFSEEWHSEIIFFSKKWFSNLKDKAFSQLFRHLLHDVWLSSSFRRNQFIVDFAFSVAQEQRNLKPNPYLADTVKYLMSVGDGTVPGLTPAIDSLSAPIAGLQKIFLEDYGLKKYAPIIMHPHHFSAAKNRQVYYSLEVPTTTVFSPRSSRQESKMVDMRELKHITEVLLSEILKGTLYVQETPLFDLAKNIQYKFYHSEKDQLDEVSSIFELSEVDSAFAKTLIDSKEYAFPEFSPFFRGCVSISTSK